MENLTDVLKVAGFTEYEIRDFADYWNYHFDATKYYKLRFLDEEYTSEHPLIIEPKPVAMIRVFFVFKEISKEEFESAFIYGNVCFEVPVWVGGLSNARPEASEGLYIVEWGGADLDDVNPHLVDIEKLIRTGRVGTENNDPLVGPSGTAMVWADRKGQERNQEKCLV